MATSVLRNVWVIGPDAQQQASLNKEVTCAAKTDVIGAVRGGLALGNLLGWNFAELGSASAFDGRSKWN
jgi:hypothetical protein